MIKKRTDALKSVLSAFDVVITILAFYLSSWLWLDVIIKQDNFITHKEHRPIVFVSVVLYSIVIVALYRLVGVYRSFRYEHIWRIWFKCAIVNAVMVGLIMTLLYFYRITDFSRGILFSFFMLSALLHLLKLYLTIGLLRAFRKNGLNQKHIILIGSGDLAVGYFEAVEENRNYGITIDGYISSERNDRLGKYLGSYDALEPLIHQTGVDEVIVAVEVSEVSDVKSVLECCEKCGTRVSVIPYYNNMISARPTICAVGKMKCFTLRSSPLDDGINRYIKRGFDIVFSLLALIISSPVMLIVALCIKLSSPGGVIFKQTRVGKNKQHFTMYKFRSMRVNSSSDSAWSTDQDSRRTLIGSFIRKTSIDELPQFFNVLKGDMSVIGPRPEIPHFVEQFREDIPKYMLKHMVRPGITGWAQVNGLRGDTSIEDRIKHDIWYIENWSAGLDIRILFRTVFGSMLNSEKLSSGQK